MLSSWTRTLAVTACLIFSSLHLKSLAITIVEDNDQGIHFDGTWLLDPNPANSGGSEHHTNVNGGMATYSFTGDYTPQRRSSSLLLLKKKTQLMLPWLLC